MTRPPHVRQAFEIQQPGTLHLATFEQLKAAPGEGTGEAISAKYTGVTFDSSISTVFALTR